MYVCMYVGPAFLFCVWIQKHQLLNYLKIQNVPNILHGVEYVLSCEIRTWKV